MSTGTERRLTAALAARAAQVTPADLSRYAPPPSRAPLRRRLGPFVGLAAVLIAVACLVVVTRLTPPAPVRPAEPPPAPRASATQPVPSVSPAASTTVAPSPTTTAFSASPQPLSSPSRTR